MNTKNNGLSAVLFDVDGTLADTERDGHRIAFNVAFNEFGLDWNWDIEVYGELLLITGGKERIRYFIERYRPEILNRTDLDDWVADLHKAKTKHFVMLMKRGEIPLRPGVARLIHQLREHNIKLAIATTTTPENVTALLESTLGADAPSWFAVIGAGDSVAQKKPAPDIYYWVLDQLGLTAQQCIAIEDSENGLQAALTANLPTIITVNNYTHSQNFNGATAVLSDLGEPSQPFTEISNVNFSNKWVNVEMLNYCKAL